MNYPWYLIVGICVWVLATGLAMRVTRLLSGGTRAWNFMFLGCSLFAASEIIALRDVVQLNILREMVQVLSGFTFALAFYIYYTNLKEGREELVSDRQIILDSFLILILLLLAIAQLSFINASILTTLEAWMGYIQKTMWVLFGLVILGYTLSIRRFVARIADAWTVISAGFALFVIWNVFALGGLLGLYSVGHPLGFLSDGLFGLFLVTGLYRLSVHAYNSEMIKNLLTTFEKPAALTALCGADCAVCELFLAQECSGCFEEREDRVTGCPIRICALDKGVVSCLECKEFSECKIHGKNVSRCPVKSVVTFHDYSKILGSSALIKYDPAGKYEEVVIDIVRSYLLKGENVVLVSSSPRTDFYNGKFKEAIDSGALKLVDITTASIMDYQKEGGIIEISMDRIEYFMDIADSLPGGSVVVFEPLSQLILGRGANVSYKFVSQTAESLSRKGIGFIALMNRVGHEEKEISNFENLFVSMAGVSDGKLEKIK